MDPRGAGGKGDVPKMIVIERRLFVDEEVALDSNYTREAECWFDMGVSKVAFGDPLGANKEVNAWVKEQGSDSIEFWPEKPLEISF